MWLEAIFGLIFVGFVFYTFYYASAHGHAMKKIETLTQALHESEMGVARLQDQARLMTSQIEEGEATKKRFAFEHTTLVSVVMWIHLTKTKIPGDIVTFDKNGCPIISGKTWGYSSRDGKITDLTPPVLEK